MLRVLVVDHDKSHIKELVTVFKEYCYDTTSTTSGLRGLEICKEWTPHLLIIEGLLHGMRAWEFGYSLLKDNPEQRPYMVAFTFYTSVLQRRLCEEVGYDEFVTKPVTLDTILGWAEKAKKLAKI